MEMIDVYYLQKHLAENPVGFLSEYGGEYDRDTVGRRLDVDRLFVPVMQSKQFALALS